MANLVNTLSSYSAMQSAFNRASSFLNLSSLDNALSSFFETNWSPTSVSRTSITGRTSVGDTIKMYGTFSSNLLIINKVRIRG